MAWRNFRTNKTTHVTTYGVQWQTGPGRQASKDSVTCESETDATVLIVLMAGRHELPDAATLLRSGLGYLLPAVPPPADRADMSLGAAIRETLDAPDRASVETNRKYRGMVDLYIDPYFADRPVSSIKRAHLRQWQTWLQAEPPLGKGLSWNTAARVRASIVTKTYKRLCAPGEWGEAPILRDNPLILLPAPSGDPYEPDILETPADAGLFIRSAYAVDRRAGDGALTLLSTGLRWGEFAGLTPAANVATKQRIHMRQAAVCHDGTWLLKPAGKSPAAKRKLPYVPTTGMVLDRQGEGIAPADLIFAAPRGGVMQHNNWHRRVWRPVMAAATAAGLSTPNLTPHGLRHSILTALGERGIDHVTLRAYAGHFTPRDVTDRYIHATDVNANKIRDAIESYLEDALSEVPA